MYISSTQNPKIKELAKLKEKKYRDSEKKYLIEGFHLIEMAKDYLLEILTTDNDFKEFGSIPITYVSSDVINKLSFTKSPQPIIGVCKYFDNKVSLKSNTIILDNLQDPGNIGAIFRSSLAFGIKDIILSLDSVDIYNDKVIRSSQGAIYKLNINYLDCIDAIKTLKNNGVTVYGTSLQNGTNLKDVKICTPYALILGNEGNGVNKELLRLTSNNIFIEMTNEIESLNVSIAGAIIMHHFYECF